MMQEQEIPRAAFSVARERNLGMELVRVTEAGALAAARWLGRGDKDGADQAAVDAMRAMLATVQMDGIVVIGEGEKDEAPMLYNGERVGNGQPPLVDIAVDPVDGTTLTAKGQPSALAVIAVAERGSMFNPGPCFYMEKIATAKEGTGIDLLIGIGGTPEGVISACAIKCLGGMIQGRLYPRSEEERQAVVDAGYDLSRVLATDDLVAGNAFFAATGISDGDLLQGVRYRGDRATTQSIVTRSQSGTVRVVTAEHVSKPFAGEKA